MQPPRVVMAGGAGTAGMALTRLLVQRGYRVTQLSRTPGTDTRAVRHVKWDGGHSGPWRDALEGACGVVNLIGAHGRHDAGAHAASIEAMADAIAACADAPPVWLQAGSLSIYGNEARTRPADERSAIGVDATARACHAAEDAFNRAPLPGVRRAVYRLGIVLGGGAQSETRARELARWAHAAGDHAHGAWVSWIHADDLARLLYWGLRMEIIAGPYNACVPDAAALDAFTRACGAAAQEPGVDCGQHPENRACKDTHAPEPLVRAVPRRFLDIAYQFRNESLADALAVSFAELPARNRSAAAALR